jgi:Zn-dependent peptidase ImmA (M78 family)
LAPDRRRTLTNVPLRSDAHYRGLVEAQLRHAGIVEPPVSVDDVAAILGVPIMTVSFPAWFTGAIVVEDGMPVVMLNSSSTSEGRRAALAHMVSHLLARIDDPSTPYPRDSQSDHRLADMMAEELVMPEFLVREQAGKWFNDYRYLARLFGVSESDMMAKMRDMGLIKARGVVWDY